MSVQTRNWEGETIQHESFGEAMNAVLNNNCIWKVSFDVGGTRVRLILDEQDGWVPSWWDHSKKKYVGLNERDADL